MRNVVFYCDALMRDAIAHMLLTASNSQLQFKCCMYKNADGLLSPTFIELDTYDFVNDFTKELDV